MYLWLALLMCLIMLWITQPCYDIVNLFFVWWQSLLYRWRRGTGQWLGGTGGGRGVERAGGWCLCQWWPPPHIPSPPSTPPLPPLSAQLCSGCELGKWHLYKAYCHTHCILSANSSCLGSTTPFISTLQGRYDAQYSAYPSTHATDVGTLEVYQQCFSKDSLNQVYSIF